MPETNAGEVDALRQTVRTVQKNLEWVLEELDQAGQMNADLFATKRRLEDLGKSLDSLSRRLDNRIDGVNDRIDVVQSQIDILIYRISKLEGITTDKGGESDGTI